MMNFVVLVGRMTRDPELRRTGNGTAATHFTLALNRNYNSADGQQADFIRVTCWNKTAENVAQYCGKGSLVGVEGRLRSGSYTNNQGVNIPTVEVVANQVTFLESRAARERYQQNQQNRVSDDNFYGGNSYSNNNYNQGGNNNYSNNNYNQGNAQSNYGQANAQGNNNYRNNSQNNNAPSGNQDQNQNQKNSDYYDMKTVDLEKDFDDAVNTYDIMDDDIQF